MVYDQGDHTCRTRRTSPRNKGYAQAQRECNPPMVWDPVTHECRARKFRKMMNEKAEDIKQATQNLKETVKKIYEVSKEIEGGGLNENDNEETKAQFKKAREARREALRLKAKQEAAAIDFEKKKVEILEEDNKKMSQVFLDAQARINQSAAEAENKRIKNQQEIEKLKADAQEKQEREQKELDKVNAEIRRKQEENERKKAEAGVDDIDDEYDAVSRQWKSGRAAAPGGRLNENNNKETKSIRQEAEEYEKQYNLRLAERAKYEEELAAQYEATVKQRKIEKTKRDEQFEKQKILWKAQEAMEESAEEKLEKFFKGVAQRQKNKTSRKQEENERKKAEAGAKAEKLLKDFVRKQRNKKEELKQARLKRLSEYERIINLVDERIQQSLKKFKTLEVEMSKITNQDQIISFNIDKLIPIDVKIYVLEQTKLCYKTFLAGQQDTFANILTMDAFTKFDQLVTEELKKCGKIGDDLYKVMVREKQDEANLKKSSRDKFAFAALIATGAYGMKSLDQNRNNNDTEQLMIGGGSGTTLVPPGFVFDSGYKFEDLQIGSGLGSYDYDPDGINAYVNQEYYPQSNTTPAYGIQQPVFDNSFALGSSAAGYGLGQNLLGMAPRRRRRGCN